MVSIEDIKDKDSLKAWLKALPEDRQYEISVTIAARAALRVQPQVWSEIRPVGKNSELKTLPLVRASLIASVACFRPTRDFKSKAAAAAADIPNANVAAADAAAFAARSVARVAVDIAVQAADFASRASAGAVKREFGTDATKLSEGSNVWDTPLWSGQTPFSDEWEATKAAWSAAGAPWDFFATWYDDLLAGRPPNWPLLEHIALTDPDQWEGDDAPKNIAARIEGVQEDLDGLESLKGSTPNGEYIGLDPATGKLDRETIHDIDGDLLTVILKRIDKELQRFASACKDTSRGNSGLIIQGLVAPEIRYLQEDLLDGAGSPLEMFNALDVCIGAIRGCVEREGFSDDRRVTRFVGVLELCSIDILKNSPSTEEVIARRKEELFERLSDESKIAILEAAHAMALESNPGLSRPMLRDLDTIKDDKADKLAKRDAKYATISRTVRGAQAKRERRILQTAKTLGDIGDTISNIDEGAEVGAGWVKAVYKVARMLFLGS